VSEYRLESPEECGTQRKVFTTPLLSEAKSDRNIEEFTKKKSRCQRGGVRGVANQNATTERTNLQTKRCSKDEAAALRKNHVVRPTLRNGFQWFSRVRFVPIRYAI
jgi:hypothetical protein